MSELQSRGRGGLRTRPGRGRRKATPTINSGNTFRWVNTFCVWPASYQELFISDPYCVWQELQHGGSVKAFHCPPSTDKETGFVRSSDHPGPLGRESPETLEPRWPDRRVSNNKQSPDIYLKSQEWRR